MSLYHIRGRELLSSSSVCFPGDWWWEGAAKLWVNACYQPDLDYTSSIGLRGPFCSVDVFQWRIQSLNFFFFFFFFCSTVYHLLSSIQISWFGLNFSLYFQNISTFLHFFWDMGENRSGRHTIRCYEVIFLSLAFTFSRL